MGQLAGSVDFNLTQLLSSGMTLGKSLNPHCLTLAALLPWNQYTVNNNKRIDLSFLHFKKIKIKIKHELSIPKTWHRALYMNSLLIFLNPYLPSWNQYCVLAPRQKSGKGRQWVGKVTCPGSHSWEVSEARFEPRTSKSQPAALPPPLLNEGVGLDDL